MPARKVPEKHNPHKSRGIKPTPIDRIFEGKVVCVVGGGPSLKKFDLSPTDHPDIGVIAVNNSYEIAPWSDVLHFADCAWWRWNGEDVLRDWPKGRYLTTATSDITHVNSPRIRRYWRDRNRFTYDRRKLHGWDSGTQAVNMAFHLGARKIVLLGIDMMPGKKGETQWHRKHRRATLVANYKSKFLPSLNASIQELEGQGIPVVHSSKPCMVKCPFEPLLEALELA